MYGRVIRGGEDGGKADRDDMDDKSRFQYLAVLQFLQAKGLIEAYVALEAECGVSYTEGALPGAAVLEASLDMFADYRSASPTSCRRGRASVVAEAAAAEEELLRLERGACCTDTLGAVVAPAPLSANVTAVCWAVARFDEFFALAATSDKRLRFLGPDGQVLAEETDLPSPVLGLDVHVAAVGCEGGDRVFEVLATAMGGEVSLFSLHQADMEGAWNFRLEQRFRDHTKHCAVGRFSPAPLAVADTATMAAMHVLTVSRDHYARLYKRGPEGSPTFVAAGVVRLHGEVTACCWASPETFVLAARDDHNLLYWDVGVGTGEVAGASGPKERMKANLNALGDSVVSFAVLALAMSPNGRLIAACTDRSRVIVLQAFGERQLRNLYGAIVEEYDTPSVCFSLDGSFVYTTSSLPQPARGGKDERLAASPPQACGQVAVFELKTGELVLQLPCHERAVRCMQRHPHTEALVTGSFDKTVKYWG